MKHDGYATEDERREWEKLEQRQLQLAGYLDLSKPTPERYMALLRRQWELQAIILKRYEDEMNWLRESMQRDMLPDWLIEAVIEQWHRRASE